MKKVSVGVTPKGGDIRQLSVEVEKKVVLAAFTTQENGQAVNNYFLNRDTGERGSISLGAFNEFDLDNQYDRKNFELIKKFAKSEGNELYNFVFDDPEEKDRIETETAEKEYLVTSKIIDNKNNIGFLKSVYRRITNFSTAAIGDQTVYSKLLQMAKTENEKFFENGVFIADMEYFEDYVFVDELIDKGLLVRDANDMIRTKDNTILADSTERCRYLFETNKPLKEEYAQMLKFKSDGGFSSSLAYERKIPEISQNVNISGAQTGADASVISKKDELVDSAKSLLEDVPLDKAQEVVDKCIEGGLFIEEDGDNNEKKYRLSAESGVSFTREKMIAYMANNGQVYEEYAKYASELEEVG